MKYNCILFDADGTLLDFSRSEAEAISEVMINNGIEVTEENVRLYSEINDSLWKMLERGEIQKNVLLYRRFELLLDALGKCADVDLAKKLAEDYMQRLSLKGYLLDGAEDMCRVLYGKIPMYIVTNGVEFIQRGRYAVCGIEKYFEGVFISGAIGAEKPAKEYFQYVADHISGFDKSRTLIVGDSLTSDMKGGVDFCIDTCWYNPKNKAAPNDLALTYIASTFEQVVNFILYGDNT